MSHDHDHGHDHHDHEHHHHEHDHHQTGELSFEEKMVRLIDHWLGHNSDHAGNYRDWAEKARAHHMDDVAGLLEEVAEMTLAMTAKFEAAMKQVKK
ncbi:hypothetical protein DENIS_5032 [Desulfonema ishimotonii]|uniref:DUF8180 domain-containing protein n=1 Tax=Desulfonema ishimotonii TaxID=45657 RepID=A0A401G468_9BACT|nr:hypothetical protein [Desulfonema ishimotonii]GBC64032.1 hypothetical protein DENIS_5032 [Desulfonema ishimotonii]